MNHKFLSKWIFLPLFSICLFFILLEFLLQIGAFVVWRSYAKNPDNPGPAQNVILCVGDSFTYGLGSKTAEGSYPAQLQKMLGQDSWKVVNAGWPGQDSAGILRNIDQLLEQYKPSLVLIMIGANDSWTKPEAVQAGEPKIGKPKKQSFEWKWRTGRLFALLKAHLVDISQESTIKKDRVAEMDNGEPKPVPQISRSKPSAEGESSLTKLRAEGWDALNSGDLQTAERIFKQCVGKSGGEAGARSALVFVYVRLGRRNDAEKEVRWLRENYEKKHLEWPGVYLAQALTAMGENKEALKLSERLVNEYPGSAWAWKEYASNSFLTGNGKNGLEGIDRAINLLPDSDPEAKGKFLTWKSRMLRTEKPAESLKLLVRRFLLDNDQGALLSSIHTGHAQYQKVDFEELLNELAIPENRRTQLRKAYSQGTDLDASSTRMILEQHLEGIIYRCLEKGAKPVLISYPFPSETEAIMSRIAGQTSIPLLNVRRTFDDLLKTTKREELFVPDGHCNEKGYGVIASMIMKTMSSYEIEKN